RVDCLVHGPPHPPGDGRRAAFNRTPATRERPLVSGGGGSPGRKWTPAGTWQRRLQQKRDCPGRFCWVRIGRMEATHADIRGAVIGIFAGGLGGMLMTGCGNTPSAPQATQLPIGRWTGENACLSVTVRMCDLVVGCGHGQFPTPTIRPDGTFAVDGTYRIEIGPISINPAPPARFSGVLKGSSLTITVTPADASVTPVSSVVQLTNSSGTCTVPCVGPQSGA